MNQRIAKALRKAAKFKPNDKRTYAKHTNGQIMNTDSSPRTLYKKAKEYFKAGLINNVDTIKESSYNGFKQVTAPDPIKVKEVLEKSSMED